MTFRWILNEVILKNGNMIPKRSEIAIKVYRNSPKIGTDSEARDTVTYSEKLPQQKYFTLTPVYLYIDLSHCKTLFSQYMFYQRLEVQIYK